MDKINQYFLEENEAIKNLDSEKIENIVKSFKKVKKEEGKIFICGNGGSSSLASHFANDLIKYSKFKYSNVFCLTDNTPLLTAISNDICYSNTFSEMLQNSLDEKDILFLISVSGSSPNIIEASKIASKNKAQIIALTGDFDTELKNFSSNLLKINSKDYLITENIQLILCHLLVLLLKA